MGMNLEDIQSASKWDDMRLGDLLGKDKGCELSKKVIKEIGPKITNCQCVESLASHLYKRSILNDDDYRDLSNKKSGSRLFQILISAVGERTRGESLISRFFLALLDLFQDIQDDWAYYTAFYVVRETAVNVLNLSSVMAQQIDISEVIEQLPPVLLSPEITRNLLHNLPSKMVSHQMNLKETLQHCHRYNFSLSLENIVEALMLTRGLGRYVTSLMPFHKSFSKDVWYFLLKKLHKKWIEFALFIGFEQSEVDAIESSAPDHCNEQVKNFSKVWRMPDLEKKKNVEVLERVLHYAKINLVQEDINMQSNQQANAGTTIVNNYFQNGSSAQSNTSVPLKDIRGQLNLPSNSQGITNLPGGNWQRLHSQQSDSNTDESSLCSHQGPSYSRQPSSISEIVSSEDISGAHTDEIQSLTEVLRRTVSETTGRERPPKQERTASLPSYTGNYTAQEKHTFLHQSWNEKHAYSNRYSPNYTPPHNHSQGISSRLHRQMAISVPQFRDEPAWYREQLPHVVHKSTLGYGPYGETLEVEYEGKVYAAKKYNYRHTSKEMLYAVFEEGGSLHKLRHRNIVSYSGIFRLPDHSDVIAMERIKYDFPHFLETRPQLEKRIGIMFDVARGLEYAHSQQLVHCDLRPTNVLVTADGVAKITDFGNSHMASVSTPEMCREQENWQDYIAPEVGSECSSNKADVFSFGHLFIYAIIENEPHPLKSIKYWEKDILKARSELERRQEYLRKMEIILEKNYSAITVKVKTCLNDEAKNRPDISQVHFWLK